jgi:hypothetical protein
MLKRERTMEDGAVANTLPSAETPMPTSRKSTPNAFTLSSGGPILPPFAAAARCNARALPDGREDKAGSKPDRLSNIIHGFNGRWPERPVSAGLGLDMPIIARTTTQRQYRSSFISAPPYVSNVVRPEVSLENKQGRRK